MKTLKTKAPPGRRGRCQGSGLIGGGCNIFSAFIMYSAEKCSFSDGVKHQEKH